jgi:hypothetical protein
VGHEFHAGVPSNKWDYKTIMKKKNTNTYISTTQIPRHFWNKLNRVPQSLFSSLTSTAQHSVIVKQQAEKSLQCLSRCPTVFQVVQEKS